MCLCFFVNQIHSTIALKLWQSTIKRRYIFEKEFGHFVVNIFFYQIFNVTWFISYLIAAKMKILEKTDDGFNRLSKKKSRKQHDFGHVELAFVSWTNGIP